MAISPFPQEFYETESGQISKNYFNIKNCKNYKWVEWVTIGKMLNFSFKSLKKDNEQLTREQWHVLNFCMFMYIYHERNLQTF